MNLRLRAPFVYYLWFPSPQPRGAGEVTIFCRMRYGDSDGNLLREVFVHGGNNDGGGPN